VARSTYIYVAFDYDGQFVMAGTVKREVIYWIKTHPSIRVHEVLRVRDGGQECGSLDLAEELGK
jgi:hypothetical protein